MENEVKEPAPKFNYVSPDEYLAMERASEEKHEYHDGYVVAMSDAGRVIISLQEIYLQK